MTEQRTRVCQCAARSRDDVVRGTHRTPNVSLGCIFSYQDGRGVTPCHFLGTLNRVERVDRKSVV